MAKCFLGDPFQHDLFVSYSHGDFELAWAQRFAVLADPTRLRLLLAIKAAGPISVSDLAVAASLTDATASQTLRYLRASGTVTTQRDGRIIRYQLHDPAISELLDYSTP